MFTLIPCTVTAHMDKYAFSRDQRFVFLLTQNKSMGSIGEYTGEKSIIENVLMENIWLMNGANGARMKSWAGPGIGYGYINNITFRSVYILCVCSLYLQKNNWQLTVDCAQKQLLAG
jgi:hypothetical protein